MTPAATPHATTTDPADALISELLGSGVPADVWLELVADALPQLSADGSATLDPRDLNATTPVLSAAHGAGEDDDVLHLAATGHARDLELLGTVAFRLAAGFWGTDRAHRLAVTGVCGGTWPQGTEAAIRALLTEPDATRAAGRLDDALPRRWADQHTTPRSGPRQLTAGRVGLATTVGWAKATGRGHSDNEDASDFARAGNSLAAAVLDGVTGPHDGSGHWAARTALEQITTRWDIGVLDPAAVLGSVTLPEPPEPLCADAATVGVLTLLDPARQPAIHLAVLGDARAYLVDPHTGTVVRISGEGSVLAEDLAAGRPGDRSTASVVTTYLGAGAVRGPLATSHVHARAGQWLVLLTDGACVTGGFDDDWAFAATLSRAVQAATSPQHLATMLTVASEINGGTDNATALVIELTTTPVHAPVPEPSADLGDLL